MIWRKSYSVAVQMKPLLPNLLPELALYTSEDNAGELRNGSLEICLKEI